MVGARGFVVDPISLKMFLKRVGARGFEPPTSRSRTECSSRSEPRPERTNYTPYFLFPIKKDF